MPRKLSVAHLWPGLVFLLFLVFCSRPQSSDYIKGNTMGTSYTLHYWGTSNKSAQSLTTEIKILLDQFENQLSNWRPDSWINKFNQTPTGETISVPIYAYEVLELCLELAKRSDGAFDPTISPLIELWGFGTRRDEIVPDKSAIQAAMQMTGYKKLLLDRENQTILKTQDGIQLNCSAVAKGYAVDLVARFLQENGIQNFLINIGGEVTAKGTKIDGSVWQVGIAKPRPDGRQGKPEQTISLENRSLATSGHSQRAFVIDEKRTSHILDARTGYPVSTNIASITVLAPNCALADGLATIALILSKEELHEILKDYPQVEVLKSNWNVSPKMKR
ncbi:MAG: FAD:protein FMN transferase [Verrucomicrobiia bacterium]